MTDLVRQGKILYRGTSEWTARDIALAHAAAARDKLVAPVMEQPQYNLFTLRAFRGGLFTTLQGGWDWATTVWSPLSRGRIGRLTTLKRRLGAFVVSEAGAAHGSRGQVCHAGYEASGAKGR